VTFTATVGRKGRLPTLRERYRVDVGNDALDPELASFVEARVAIEPREQLRFEAASWVRRQSGMILLDRDRNVLGNVGELDLRGIDALIAAKPLARVDAVLAWSFTEASDDSDSDPLDFLPRHRAHASLKVSPVERASLGTRLVWISEQVDRNTTIPSHAEWELEAVVRPIAGWLAAARVDDVLDERWPLRPGVPSPGRTLTVTVQATFE
jgi:outer membrane cobalamin receptor